MLIKIRIRIECKSSEVKDFVYKYKDRALGFEKDKKERFFDLVFPEGAPELDEIRKHMEAQGVGFGETRKIDYTVAEVDRIPYFRMDVEHFKMPDDALKAGATYMYKGCKKCCSGAVQLTPLKLPLKRLKYYDIVRVAPELVISRRVKELFDQKGVLGCEYLEVYDKKTKKPTPEYYELRITTVLPKVRNQDFVTIREVCPVCGEPTLDFFTPRYYRLCDFSEGKDFYLTADSFFYGNHVLKEISDYRIHRVIVSKKIKEILQSNFTHDPEQVNFAPIHFAELYQE